ncbi:MAG: DUF2092 domain-containing protein [Gammaproteobacteria bacterium]|nr:DUF2092 domain-containing protein [Gammaproteobacteria bacterium]
MKLSGLRQILLGLVLSVSMTSYALDTPPQEQLDPFVMQLVKQVSDYLTTANSFSVRSDVTTDEVLPSGEKIQLSRRAQVVVRRPDRLRAEVHSDFGTTRFYYDGKKLSRFDMDNNVYGSIKVPGTIEEALDHAMENYGVDAPLADLLAGDLYENFISNTRSGSYVGLHYLDGAHHHHLALSNDHVDFQLWISDDAAPLIRKIVITYKHVYGEPQLTAVLSDWNFDPRTPDMIFDFHPPIDADELDFLSVKSSIKGVKK